MEVKSKIYLRRERKLLCEGETEEVPSGVTNLGNFIEQNHEVRCVQGAENMGTHKAHGHELGHNYGQPIRCIIQVKLTKSETNAEASHVASRHT